MSLANGAQMLFYILLLVFVVQSIVLGYHWFTYGSSRRISLVALAVYLLGGAVLFVTLSIALNTL